MLLLVASTLSLLFMHEISFSFCLDFSVKATQKNFLSYFFFFLPDLRKKNLQRQLLQILLTKNVTSSTPSDVSSNVNYSVKFGYRSLDPKRRNGIVNHYRQDIQKIHRYTEELWPASAVILTTVYPFQYLSTRIFCGVPNFFSWHIYKSKLEQATTTIAIL